MAESSTSEACWAPRRSCAFAALYFLSASLFALDPMVFDVLFGFDPTPDAPLATVAAGFASIAALFGAVAIASEDLGTFAGEPP